MKKNNLLVVLVSVGVFLIAFLAILAIANASRPPTLKVLGAARTLNFGEQISPDDLVEITVYKDARSSSYVTMSDIQQIVGGYIAIPIPAGQPITRDAVMASAGIDSRLSALLSEYPGYSLFPLPLDAPNIVAADPASYLPGDMVSVTVVIASRPYPPVTPTPAYSGPGSLITPTPAAVLDPVQSAVDRSYPPMSKNLFPGGVRVVAVQGLPAVTVSDETLQQTGYSYVDYNQPKRLILLVPSDKVEMLALALGIQSGNMVVVSTVSLEQPEQSAGFTYWDFEDWFKQEREEVLK